MPLITWHVPPLRQGLTCPKKKKKTKEKQHVLRTVLSGDTPNRTTRDVQCPHKHVCAALNQLTSTFTTSWFQRWNISLTFDSWLRPSSVQKGTEKRTFFYRKLQKNTFIRLFQVWDDVLEIWRTDSGEKETSVYFLLSYSNIGAFTWLFFFFFNCCSARLVG